MSKPVPGPFQVSIQSILAALHEGETDHSPPHSAKVKNSGAIPLLHLHAFIASIWATS